jgi:hypothetical protein
MFELLKMRVLNFDSATTISKAKLVLERDEKKPEQF